eukprot:936362-Amphidinium_carterae.1
MNGARQRRSLGTLGISRCPLKISTQTWRALRECKRWPRARPSQGLHCRPLSLLDKISSRGLRLDGRNILLGQKEPSAQEVVGALEWLFVRLTPLQSTRSSSIACRIR